MIRIDFQDYPQNPSNSTFFYASRSNFDPAYNMQVIFDPLLIYWSQVVWCAQMQFYVFIYDGVIQHLNPGIIFFQGYALTIF